MVDPHAMNPQEPHSDPRQAEGLALIHEAHLQRALSLGAHHTLDHLAETFCELFGLPHDSAEGRRVHNLFHYGDQYESKLKAILKERTNGH